MQSSVVHLGGSPVKRRVRFLMVKVMWLRSASSSFGVEGVPLLVFFLRVHFLRKVPHRVFVESELQHRVDFVCFCLFFVLVHFLREGPSESVFPVLMDKMVSGDGSVV